ERATRHPHLAAASCQLERGATPDTGVRARDEETLSLEIPHHRRPHGEPNDTPEAMRYLYQTGRAPRLLLVPLLRRAAPSGPTALSDDAETARYSNEPALERAGDSDRTTARSQIPHPRSAG